MLEVDARGLSCPIPVVRTKEALDEASGKTVAVLLDAAVAVENVTRLALSRDCKVHVESLDGGDFRVVITPK